MTVQATSTRISADEFLSQDYPTGSELIDGVVYEMDPDFRHQRLCSRIYQAIFLWTMTREGHGEVGWGGNWVLTDADVYKPDVWWTPSPPEGARHDGPPALAAGVRSPGTWRHDIGRKLREYAAAGTKELWLVDTPAHVVLVCREGSFDEPLELGAGESLTSPLLPGFALDIDALFAAEQPLTAR